MKKNSDILPISDILKSLNHPQAWQLAALLQDNIIWSSLLDSAFLSKVERRLKAAARKTGHLVLTAELSPAALALDALEYPEVLSILRTNPLEALPEPLQRCVNEGDERSNGDFGPVQTLRAAGLHAIALHQQITKNPNSPLPAWEDLVEELPHCATTMAILYGMLPKPAALLAALIKTARQQPRSHQLICHVLLSNPLNPDALQSIFQRLLVQAGHISFSVPAAPSNTALEIVQIVSELRPELGARLAGWLAAETPSAQMVEAVHPAAAIPALLARAKLHQLNGSTEQATAELSQAANQANLLLAELQTVHPSELSHTLNDTSDALEQLAIIKAGEEPRPHPWIVRQRTNHLSRLAGHLLNAGLAAEALDAARLLQERSAGNPNVHFILGASLLAQGKSKDAEPPNEWLASAVRNLELASALDPHSIEKLRYLAEAYVVSRRYEEGLAIHEQIVAEAELCQEPGLLQDVLALGAVAIKAGSSLRAIEAANQALGLLEAFPESGEQASHAYALLGKGHQLMADYPSAIINLQAAVQQNPLNVSAWLDLDACAQATGNQVMRVETLSTAVQSLPNNPELYLALGLAQFDQHLLTEAQESLARAHELCAEECKASLKHQVALAYGRVMLALNHQTLAGSLLAEANALRPGDKATAGLYGRWLLQNDQAAQAATVLDNAANDPASDPTLALDFSNAVLKSNGDPQRAIQSLRAVLPVLDSETADEAFALLGEAHSRQGEYQVAFDIFRDVLLRSPHLDQQKNGALSRGFGCAALALSTQKPELREVAHAALQDAAALCPDHAPTRRFLAEAAWANGLDNEAWIAAKAALEIDGSLTGVMWFAARVLEHVQTAQDAQPETNIQPGALPVQAVEVVKRAVRALRACKQQDGLPNPALLQLARLFRLSNQPANALGALKAIQASPMATASELEETARQYLALQDAENGLKSLVLAAGKANSPEQKAGLLAQQSEMHTILEQPTEAVAALHAAIETSPYEMLLHIRLVKLLTFQRQYDLADQAAQRALEACEQGGLGTGLDLTTAAVYSQLAELYLATGRLVQSYAHASRAIEIFAASPQAAGVYQETAKFSDAKGAAFAAAVQSAHGLLLPGKAAALLRNPAFPLGADSASLNITLRCLAAQQALGDGVELEAAEHLTPVMADAASATHPWVRILQARLLISSKRDRAALEQASQILDGVMNDFQQPTSPKGRDEHSSALEMVALKGAVAAMPFKGDAWDNLLNVVKTVIGLIEDRPPADKTATPAGIPESQPLVGLLLVELLVGRAEFRQLCLDLQAIQAAPPPDPREAVVCFNLLQNVETALLNARQQAAALPAENLACDLDESAWGPAMQTLERWKTRAAAVFGEPLPASWIAWDAARLVASGMEADAAAYLANLRKQTPEKPPLAGSSTRVQTSPLNRLMPVAHQLGQAHLEQPLVQIQAALITASLRPETAQAFAKRAVDTTSHAHNDSNAISPLAPLAHVTHALMNLNLGFHGLALESYQAALKIMPEEPRWHLACANLLAAVNQADGEPALEEAVNHLEEAVRLEPGYAPHSLALSKILVKLDQRAKPAQAKESTSPDAIEEFRQHALRTLERASRLFPGDAAIWLALARAQANETTGSVEPSVRSKPLSEAGRANTPSANTAAQTCARKAVETAHKANQPDIEAAALCLSGQIALKTRDAETAYRAGRQAVHMFNLAANKDTPAANSGRLADEELTQLGSMAVLVQVEALEMLGRFADALELLENHLELLTEEPLESPSNVETAQEIEQLPLRLKHAHLVSKVHGPAAGIERLEHIQSQTAEPCPQVEAALAFDMAAAGRHDEAMQQARQALNHMAAQPVNGVVASFSKELLPLLGPADLHALLGRLLARQGQLDQAVHQYASAVKANPGMVEAHLEMADVYNRQRQYNRALQTLEQATKAAPLDPRAYHMAGVLYREGRDFPRAAEMLRRAADLDPDNAEIRRHLLAVMAAGFFSSANNVVEPVSQGR